jgi:hypothetical protein
MPMLMTCQYFFTDRFPTSLRACLKTPQKRRVRARGLQEIAQYGHFCRPGALTGRVFKQALRGTAPPKSPGQTHQNQAKNSAASGEAEALPRLIRLSPFACPFFSGLGVCCFFDRRMGTNELSARLNARPAGFIQDSDAFALPKSLYSHPPLWFDR